MPRNQTHALRCIVTAGPTWEPLDQVRRLTNMSTGRLGCELASFLSRAGHRVTLLCGEASTWAGIVTAETVQTFSTGSDLALKLHDLAGHGADALFHAAAVGDFRAGRVWAVGRAGHRRLLKPGKLPTRLGTLLAELVPTEKILPRLRDWFQDAKLVGWKYEVEGDRTSAVQAAIAQLKESRTDLTIVNGPAYGTGFGLVSPDGRHVPVPDRAALYSALAEWLRS